MRRTANPRGDTWVFSTENLKRSQAEVSAILSAIEAKAAALAHDPFMHQKGIRIQAIGRLDLLPEPLVAAICAAEAMTAHYDGTDNCSWIRRTGGDRRRCP